MRKFRFSYFERSTVIWHLHYITLVKQISVQCTSKLITVITHKIDSPWLISVLDTLPSESLRKAEKWSLPWSQSNQIACKCADFRNSTSWPLFKRLFPNACRGQFLPLFHLQWTWAYKSHHLIFHQIVCWNQENQHNSFCCYFPERRGDACCRRLNFTISKLVC